MRICGLCSMNDGTVYTSMPPKYKCTVTNEFYFGDHPCELDLVPVVRCGECKHLFRIGKRGICLKDHDGGFNTLPDEWYCADGERRDG